jgi:hypothetical protein
MDIGLSCAGPSNYRHHFHTDSTSQISESCTKTALVFACFRVGDNLIKRVDCRRLIFFWVLAVETEPLESLGDSITSAVLLSWNKKPGDAIAEDDVIAVVETDKVHFALHLV